MRKSEIKRRPMPDTVIESLKPEAVMYRELHGDGVYLRVKPSGTKDWQLRYKKPHQSNMNPHAEACGFFISSRPCLHCSHGCGASQRQRLVQSDWKLHVYPRCVLGAILVQSPWISKAASRC